MTRPSFDQWMLDLARTAATRSTCARAKVGAVVARDNRVLALGYVGSAPGETHCIDGGCLMGETGGCVRTVHAEVNALEQAVQHGVGALLEGATLYTTLSPCQRCAECAYAFGIARVVYATPYRRTEPIEWLRARGVRTEVVT